MKELNAEQLLTYFQDTHFQTFYDPDSTKKPKLIRALKKYKPIDLKVLNKQKAGIYFSVNGFANSRKETQLTKLNAIYDDADIGKSGDGQTKQEKKKKKKKLWKRLKGLKYRPNIITVTANGLQPIWLIDEDKTDEETKQQYKDVTCGIIEKLKKYGSLGDKVKDISRVLRLPGYYHMKAEPFMVKAYLLHEERYKLEDLEEAFPYFDNNQIADDDAKVYKSLRTLDDLTMKEVALEALTAHGEPQAYFDDKGRIVLERGVTGAFKGKKGDREYIGSNSHELPHGNKITFVRRLLNLNSNKESYQWIKDKFDLKTYKEKTYKKKTKQVVEKASWLSTPRLLDKATTEINNTNPEDIIQYGYNFLDSKLGGIFPGETILVGGVTGTGKTTFVTRVARHVAQKHKVGFVCLEDRLEDYAIKTLYFEIGTIRTGKNYPWIEFRKNNIKSPTYKKEVKQAKEKLNLSNLHFLKFDHIIGIDALEKIIEEKHLKDGTRFFVIDHLHMLDFNSRLSKERVIEDACKKLAKLKDRFGLSFMLVAHFRKVKETQPPTMSDFKDAMALSQTANTVIILWRDRSPDEVEEYNKRPTKFYVPKARMGLFEFTTEVNFDKAKGDYEDRETVGGCETGEIADIFLN